ncbi:hypothetical protein ANAPC1_00002 [Anaplasma phagocytophilum]|uniref:Uncharacterized protein n=1 Tax=Anaplasma phagocytophilum TaxID=948 RepID=A0AA45URN0_ANAPH|nr:hypothetical protein ANAPC1_00002 [Anaplasma phagocytophilum]
MFVKSVQAKLHSIGTLEKRRRLRTLAAAIRKCIVAKTPILINALKGIRILPHLSKLNPLLARAV